jgi:hypothetical protein
MKRCAREHRIKVKMKNEKGIKFLAVLGLVLLYACGNTLDTSNNNTVDPPPDPTLDCDVFEIEPNDEFFTAQFIDVLPAIPTNELVCGYLSPAGADIDTYYFPLAPNPEATQVIFNLIVTCDLDVLPVVELLQMIHDVGAPAFDPGAPPVYESLGTFFGAPGVLTILDWPVPYDFLNQNNLFVRVTGLSTSTDNMNKLYKLDYFTQ